MGRAGGTDVRIAIVSPYDLAVAGGVQVHVESLAAALRSRGDEVRVVGPGPDAAGRLGVGASVPVPANGSRAPVSLDPRAIARVRRVLRRLAPDVVHVHEPLVPVVGPAAVLAADAPVVLTFHAMAEAGLLPHLYRAVRGPARVVVARAAELTAVSPVAAAFHARALGLDVDGIRIVPNGVDFARFSSVPSVPSVPDASPTAVPDATAAGGRIVFLGRLEHRKGADLAVRAFLRLAGRRPESRLQVLGDGPQAPMLRALVAAAPPSVRDRIELSGRVHTAALPALLAAADVVLLPSRGGESFGLVLLEAMAAGTTIVASDIPGYRAVARHEVEAILVRPDDADGLVDALGRVLDDAALSRRLRGAGRIRAQEHDWSIVAERMREVYDAAIASGARPDGRR